jgi:hypothetical protein
VSLLTIAKSTGTAMFLAVTAKTPSWVRGSHTKGINTGCRKKEICRLSPSVIGHWKIWVSSGTARSAGERDFEFGSPRANDIANSQQLLAPNHLQYGIDGESPARKKKKRRFESQVSRYDPIKMLEIALEND